MTPLSDYAQAQGISENAVFELTKHGKIDCQHIDGVWMVIDLETESLPPKPAQSALPEAAEPLRGVGAVPWLRFAGWIVIIAGLIFGIYGMMNFSTSQVRIGTYTDLTVERFNPLGFSVSMGLIVHGFVVGICLHGLASLVENMAHIRSRLTPR